MVGVVGSLANLRFAGDFRYDRLLARPRYSLLKNFSMNLPAICLPRVFA